MPLARVLRISLLAALLPLLFRLSQSFAEGRGQPTVPGMGYALGVLAVLFFVRAWATENTLGPQATGQKDLLWGVALGCAFAIVARLL